jgi:hypothetical protein
MCTSGTMEIILKIRYMHSGSGVAGSFWNIKKQLRQPDLGSKVSMKKISRVAKWSMRLLLTNASLFGDQITFMIVSKKGSIRDKDL